MRILSKRQVKELVLYSPQHIARLEKVIGNVANMMVFRVRANDAPFLERLMPKFSAYDLQNQPNHRANVYLTQHSERLKPFIAPMYPAYHRTR